ncbi:hypothetical protein [Sulfitobacter sp. 1A12157]|uniref:hypothetical protein n=1 Tax=Sulfitobacter sp. 1A12157 TaxID=3368594 RepID=UPI003746A0F0
MISPEGYVSLYSLLIPFPKKWDDDYNPVCVRQGLELTDEFFVFSKEGGLCAVPKHVIFTAHDEMFLFLDEESWSVTMDHLREMPERLGQDFDIDLGLFGVFAGSPMPPIPQVAQALLAVDGDAVVIRETEVDKVRSRIRRAYAETKTRTKNRNLRGEDAKQAFLEFIRQNPDCTAVERDAFGTRNLSQGRDAARVLWKELGPPDGSKPGRKPIQR